MTDFNKSPLKHIDARLAWWMDFSENILRYAHKLEDELSDTFRDDRYNEVPDVDAPLVHQFVDLLYDIYNSAKQHQIHIQAAQEQHERFCNYWVFGQGNWNGIHEFLQEEVIPL